jgi:soluble lytic murein transglycosylase
MTARRQGVAGKRKSASLCCRDHWRNSSIPGKARAFMKAGSAFILALAVLASGTVHAQVPARPAPTAGGNLPAGLIRQGTTVMMQPIPDSDAGYSPSPGLGGERRPGLERVLSASDEAIFSRAIDAAARGDWTAARNLADQGHDATARRVITWRYLLDRNSGAGFSEIAQFLRDNPDWPEHDTLQARAEEAIGPMTDPHTVIAWFGDRTPITGVGKVRLGEALIATGTPTRGRDLIRRAWAEDTFDPNQELSIIAQHGDALTADADRRRLERLLAHNDLTAARREIARVDAEIQRLAQTRIELRSDPARGERAMADLSPSLRDDPGLLFDEAHLLRQRNDVATIPSLLARAPTRAFASLNPTRWWAEISLDARTALQTGAWHTAYALAAVDGLPRDSNEYSEAEFLAGWIALRGLHEPRIAASHFQNLASAVSRPISLARAHYWEGRALEAEGDMETARQQFHLAAQYPETFYGQLALARVTGEPYLRLPPTLTAGASAHAAYDADELVQAARVVGDLGLVNLVREFAVRDVDLHREPGRIRLLAEELTRMGFREIAVRAAKEASYNGIELPEYSHPVITVPHYQGPGYAPETPFVLAIIRQETEFDQWSVSGAGARGIMQVMPEGAKHSAQLAGLSWRPSDLTGDPGYNMQLGMTELAGDLADWSGSYVLAAAAYNAGPGNVRKWIATFGDPRDARVDPLDWIEEIPFSETRNYVQRVLENVEVYRDRLSGHEEPLRILADLYRPDAPPPQTSLNASPASGSSPRTEYPPPKPAADVAPRPVAAPAVMPTPAIRSVPDRVTQPASAPDVTPIFKPSQ